MKKLIIFLTSLLFADTYFLDKGWNLLGAMKDINASYLNVKIVWKYKDGNWSYYSNEFNLDSPKIDLINKQEGFWVSSFEGVLFTDRVLILPLYMYDLNTWDKVSNANSDEIVIVNPNNGVGDGDENYKNLISTLVANLKVPIGYIYTKWGNRNIEEVKGEIDKWLSIYPDIKGFFIDEAASSSEKLNYYKELYEYIKEKGNYYIVLNPGVYPDEDYFGIADNVVVFESNASSLREDICIHPLKSSIIVYAADKEKAKEIINNYKCKYIYITDDDLPNPYDSLPSYFDEEIEFLK